MARLTERLGGIAALAGRVHSASRLSGLMSQRGVLAQVCPAAFTLPLGIGGSRADAVTGLFRQPVTWLDGVLLVVRSAGDATGEAALLQLEPLIEATIAAIVGWGPEDMIGVYELAKGELTSMEDGLLTYQLEFSIEDQLRIAR